MNKQEFLAELKKGLAGLQQKDIEERLTFYGEMIDDRTEEGLSEEDAVSQIGTVEDILSHTLSETPSKKAKSGRTLRTWEIILLISGAPIWLSLLIAFVCVVLAAYVVIWSAIISLWAIEASLLACSLASVVSAVIFAIGGNGVTGVAMIGAGFVCTGMSIFFYYGSTAATKGTLFFTKKLVIWIKNRFAKKGGNAV